MTQLFLGRLEQESNQKLLEKQLRLKRIQQVREQENTIRAKQCTRYRQCINESKSLKANQIKTVKLTEKQCKQEEIINRLQNALVHTGDAHRYAVDQIKRHKYEIIYESKRMETIQLNVVRREQRALEIHKQKMIEQNQHNEEIKNLKNIRDDFRHSEREDAHAAGETFASRKRMAENQRQWANAQCSGPSVKTTLRVKQSALCVEHRCEVNVNAKVMRHGLGPRDASIVINDAAHEEVSLQKRQWARIMHQLLTNKKVLRRGKTAKAKVEMLRGVQFLDEELKLLQAADRTGVRVDRVRNGSSVPSVGRTEHTVRDAFEELFMSRPIDTSYAAQQHTSQENDYYNDYPQPPETTRPLVRVPEVPPLRPQHIVSGVHQPPVSLRNTSGNPMFFNAHSYVNERGGRRYQEQQEASEMDLLFPPNVPDTYDSRSSASGENSTSRSSNSDDSSVASRDSLCRSAPLTRTQQWASPAASPPSSRGSTPQQQQQQTPPRSGLTMLQVDFTPQPSQQGGNSSNVQADASWLQAAELLPVSHKAKRSGDRFSDSLRSDSTDPARHDGHHTGTDSSMNSADKGVAGRRVGSGSTTSGSGSGSGLSANSFSFLHKFQPKASPHSPDSVASSLSLDVLRRSTGELSDNASEEDSLCVDYRHLSGMLSQSATPSAAPAVPPEAHSSRHSVSSRGSCRSSRAEGPVVHNRVSRESISFDDSSLSGEEWVPRSTASQHSSSRSSASQSATSWALAPQQSLVRGGQSASLDSSDTLHSSLQSSEQSSSLASRPVFPPLNSFAAEDPLRTNALPLSRPPMPPPHLSSSLEAKTDNRHFHVPPGEQGVRDGSRSDQLHSGSWAVSSTSSSLAHSLRDSRGLDVETISNLSQSTDFLFRQWEDLHRTNAALQQTRSASEAANGPRRTSDLSLSSSDSDTVSRGETSLSTDDHSQSRGQSTRGASAMRDHSVWSSSAAEESSESRESHESALEVSHRASFFAHSSALDPLVSGASEHQSAPTGRVSYDEERAVRLMRELDELSRDWQRQLATDSNSPLHQPALAPQQLSSVSTNRIGGHDWSSSSSSSSGPQSGVRASSIDTALLNASQDGSHSDSSSELLRDSLSTLSSAANSVVLTAITTLPSTQFYSPAADRTASVTSTANVLSGSRAEENNEEEEEEEVSLQDLLLGASTSHSVGGPFSSHLSMRRVTESHTTDTRSRVSTGFSSFTASALASLEEEEEEEEGELQFSSSLYRERPGATVSTTSSTLSTVFRSTYIRSENTNTLSNALLATPLTAYSLSQNNTANFSGSSGSPLTGSGRYGAGVSILSTHSLADTSLSTPRLQNRDNDVDSSSDSGSSSGSSSGGSSSSESGQELSSTLSLLSS